MRGRRETAPWILNQSAWKPGPAGSILPIIFRVPCTYSLTTKLDITPIMEVKLYPTMLYLIARAVNRYPEFRMDLDRDGSPGTYSVVHPCYTVFHRDDETFSSIWTEYTEDYAAFCGPTNRTWHSLGTTMA